MLVLSQFREYFFVVFNDLLSGVSLLRFEKHKDESGTDNLQQAI